MSLKKILVLVFFAFIFMLIIVTFSDAGIYVTFSEAKYISSLNNEKQVHIVGFLKMNEYGDVIGIKKSIDGLSFSFLMFDSDKNFEEVYYNQPMPIDFMKSEQIVVIGSYKNNNFLADKLLIKCPSKYKDENIDFNI